MLQAALREYAEDEVQLKSLEAIQPDDETLITMLDDFMETRQGENTARVVCFWELRPSNIGAIVGGQRRIVSFLVLILTRSSCGVR